MLYHEIETGNIRLTAGGENAFIARGSKKIKIPSGESETKLIEEFQKTHDNAKLEKSKKEFPKLAEGDKIICGAKTIVYLTTSYNNGKENPIDDYKARASKTVFMGPNSELQVSGFEKWDKKDNKEKTRCHGELIKNIELKKGFFQVSYSHTDDVLVTPVALIKFNFDGSGFFDVCDDVLYSSPLASTSIGAGGVEYTNKATKRSFTAKSTTFEEIIVTRDAIYRKGLTKMDDIFNNAIALNGFFQNKLTATMPTVDEKQMAESYKNMPKNMEQMVGSLEMFKQMSPDDLTRMMKIGEAKSGTKISPEVMERMKEMPEMLKKMEKDGMFGQMKKAMAMQKGLMEGMGDKGIERLVSSQKAGMEMLKKQKNMSTAEGIDIEQIIESPRVYKPVTKDGVKVA
ncbi:MAG: hypothetical protein V1722_04980 [Candidatus Micrarchaeota archaeon]